MARVQLEVNIPDNIITKFEPSDKIRDLLQDFVESDALASNSAHWPVRVRVQIAEALGKIGGPKAENVLRTMLNDSSSQVHETTSKALKTLVR